MPKAASKSLTQNKVKNMFGLFDKQSQNTINIDSKTIEQLKKFNLVMGIVHLIQAALVFVLSNNFSLPVTTAFLGFDPKTKSISPVNNILFDLKIGPIVALFFLISAAAHFSITTPKLFDWYATNLRKKINYIRWYEYAFSSSIMIVLIAMLCGMYDLPSLVLLFTLNVIMNLCGLMMELYNQTTKSTKWTPFVIGCIAGIAPWIAIVLYFYGASQNTSGAIPTFVYFILL